MLAIDPRNAEVVHPYLGGDDLNQRPDGSPSRWVIDFGERAEEDARQFVAPFAHVERLVRPERLTKDEKNYPRMVYEWWKFWNARPGLYGAIRPLDRCIVLARVSKTLQPMFVPASLVYMEKLVVFAYDDDAHFGLLSSGVHWWWGVSRSTTLGGAAASYTPTDVFETLVQPELTSAVGERGGALHAHRSALMRDRQEGLTKTYNRVHDPDEVADDIVRLRELHVGLDHAVRDAYGWGDLELGHDFHPTKFGVRYTFAPVPRQEILDRLLELNHERYAEEVRQGLHGKPKPKRSRTSSGAMTLGLDHG